MLTLGAANGDGRYAFALLALLEMRGVNHVEGLANAWKEMLCRLGNILGTGITTNLWYSVATFRLRKAPKKGWRRRRADDSVDYMLVFMARTPPVTLVATPVPVNALDFEWVSRCTRSRRVYRFFACIDSEGT